MICRCGHQTPMGHTICDECAVEALFARGLDNVKKDMLALIFEKRNLQALLNSALNKEVWYWQGDGQDFPETITCPVLMNAHTLRQMLQDRSDPAPWMKKV